MKFVVAIFLAIGIGLSLVMFRTLLTEPGLVEWTSDFRIHYNIVLERTFWLYTWHPYVFDTDNSPTLSMSFIYSLFLSAPSSEIAQRLMILTVYIVMFTSMSTVFFLWFRNNFRQEFLFASSLLSGALYTLNPWVAAESIHWFVLWNYSWAPALLFLTHRAILVQSPRRMLGYSFLSGSILTILGNPHGIVFSLVLMGLFLIVYTASQHGSTGKTLKLSVSYLLTTISLMLVFSAYWVVPFALQYSSQITAGPSWVIYSPRDLISTSTQQSLVDAMRLQYPISYSLLSAVMPTYAVSVSLSLSWIVPLLSLAAVLIGRRDPLIRSVGAVGLVFLFLSKGTGAPLGEVYFYLGTQVPILSNLGWVLFKPAYLYTGLLCLSFSILVGYSAASIGSSLRNRLAFLQRCNGAVGLNLSGPLPKTRHRGSKLGVLKRVSGIATTFGMAILLCLLIVGISLNGLPLLTGNLGGYMQPIQLPNSYVQMNAWLASQPDDSRTGWLPPSLRVVWSPYEQTPPFLNHDELSPLPVWASAKPVLGLGVTYQFPTRARVFPQFFAQDALQRNLTSWVGKLYGIANVGYVIYHADVVDQSSFESLQQNLNNQKDLSLAYTDGPLYVYRNVDNLPEIQGVGKSLLVIGGLDSYLQTAAVQGYNPMTYPSIFLEQSPLSIQQLTSYVSYSDALMFFGPKNLDDIVLSTIGRDYYVAPQDSLTNTLPLSSWNKDFFYSNLWVPSRLDGLNGIKFDLDLGEQILLTDQTGANTKASFTASEPGLYDVWARVLLSPRAGSLDFGVDGKSWTLDSSSNALMGFKWMKIGSTDLALGSHTLAVTNDSGFNAVNLVAVVPHHVLEERETQVTSLIQNTLMIYADDANALSIYANKTDFDQFSAIDTTSGWSVGNGAGTFSLDNTDYVDGVPSVAFFGSSDSMGNFYSWYVPPVPQDISHWDTLRFWIKTAVDIPRLRVYVQDTSKNFMQFFIPVPKGGWQLVSLNLKNYDSESPTPPDLKAVEAINFGFTADSSSHYTMKLADVYVSNDLRQWNLAPLVQGNYTLAVVGAPESADAYTRIIIGNQSFSLNFNQEQEQYLRFTQAGSNATIIVSSHHMQHLSLIAYEDRDGSNSLSTIFRSRLVPSISEFRKIDPTRWDVEVNATSPFLLEFGEAQSPLWKVADEMGNSYPGISLNSIINGFWISRTGRYHLTIEYSSQKSLQEGVLLSLVSFPLTMFLYVLARYPLLQSMGRKLELSKKGRTDKTSFD
jgi:hypothetical protein